MPLKTICAFLFVCLWSSVVAELDCGIKVLFIQFHRILFEVSNVTENFGSEKSTFVTFSHKDLQFFWKEKFKRNTFYASPTFTCLDALLLGSIETMKTIAKEIIFTLRLQEIQKKSFVFEFIFFLL